MGVQSIFVFDGPGANPYPSSCSLVSGSCTCANRSDQLLRLTTWGRKDCTQRLREYFYFEAKQRKVDMNPLTWAVSRSNV
uniref:XPG N-terminal domain-containing protein n=1 Tax=Ditylenchus dipsaci TaxID=166011 RepID=A0A915D554_9BILA